MVIVYATMSADTTILNNDKLVRSEHYSDYLRNKIVVMDEEFYLKHIEELGIFRTIVVGNSNLETKFDVESYDSIYKVINSKVFNNKELYVIGSDKFVKETIPMANKMIFDIVDEFQEFSTSKFPNYNVGEFEVSRAIRVNPSITRIVMDRKKEDINVLNNAKGRNR